MILTFYDLETSGLKTSSCDVHQVAYARYDTDTDTFVHSNSFFLWESTYEWTEEAAKINGLTFGFLNSLPKEEMPKKYQELYAVFHRAHTIGYNNIKFDDEVMRSFMRRHAEPVSFESQQDVRDMARAHFGGPAGHCNECAERLGVTEKQILDLEQQLFGAGTQAHDARYDVAMTFLIYKALREVV